MYDYYDGIDYDNKIISDNLKMYNTDELERMKLENKFLNEILRNKSTIKKENFVSKKEQMLDENNNDTVSKRENFVSKRENYENKRENCDDCVSCNAKKMYEDLLTKKNLLIMILIFFLIIIVQNMYNTNKQDEIKNMISLLLSEKNSVLNQ